VTERDDRTWAAAAAERLVAEAREEAVAEVRARLRARMVEELMRAVDAPAEAPEPQPPSGTALWLYGVTGASVPDPDGWAGVDGGPSVRAIRSEGIAALVSDVALAEFGPDVLHEQLEDLDRVEALARAHEEVLDQALDRGAVVPFRMCTMYGSEASLLAMLDRQRPSFEDALRRLEGVREWGVKAFLTGGGEPAGSVAEPAGAASGTAYLVHKQQARKAAEHARERVWATAERIHARLSEQAADSVLGRPQDRRLSGRDDEMVLNASYLVPDDRLEGFEALVADLGARHADAGIELELTGPWPAYHFVEADRDL
jgi:hypothetical protein